MKDEIHVKISGSAIYSAVKNHLQNDDNLKSQIQAHVEKFVENGSMEALVKKRVQEQVDSHYIREEIKRLVQVVINGEVKKSIDAQIQESIRKILENSVIVMPKRD